MTSLTDFLLARIDDDEAVAQHGDGGLMEGAHFDPDRVLAECEAKRQLLIMWHHDSVYPELRVMASVYSNHPDYRAEWRP